jgi:hypothetical protein
MQTASWDGRETAWPLHQMSTQIRQRALNVTAMEAGLNDSWMDFSSSSTQKYSHRATLSVHGVKLGRRLWRVAGPFTF